MAAPNLKNPTYIYGKTARYAVPVEVNSLPVEMLPAPGTGKTYKINSIFCANVDGDNPADISVSIYDGSTDRYLAKTISVPADATQIISTKETYFYLEEGDSIRASANVAGDLELVIGYEDIS
jgi:hypothetical protein